MNNGSLIKAGDKISNWDKPGGTLGMIVAAIAICGIAYVILPYLVSITWNLVSIALGVCILTHYLFYLKPFLLSLFLLIHYY
jgi:hypothetical protein